MNPQTRSITTWGLLVGSALTLAILAVALIRNESLRQEAADTQLLATESNRLRSLLTDYFREIKRETAHQLIAFHEEGLANQLRRWSNANPLIQEAGIESPSDEAQRRFNNAIDLVHLENADTPSIYRSGYYEENRDIAKYESGSVDPVLAWSLENETDRLTWSVTHRLGPDRPARYALLATNELIQSFESLLKELAGASLTTNIEPSDGSPQGPTASLEELLPGYRLAISIEQDKVQTRWLVHFGYGMVALCIGLCATCTALLARQSAKERHNALRKTTFVSQISHEFKTPLTSIALYADLLATTNVPEDKRLRYLDTIGRESHRLSDLVDNLLALSALEQGKKRYRMASINLGATITAIVNDYRPALSSAGMEIEWTPPQTTALAHADPAVFRQALLNLLDNARKYAREGGIVAIAVDEVADQWLISISDHGPGVPASLVERVFEAFFQEKSLLINKSPGAGLGLSVSRRMLRDCQGELSFDSSYAEGARFIIRVPKAPTEGSPSEADAPSP